MAVLSRASLVVALLAGCLSLAAIPVARAEPLRDIASFGGVRDNELIGYGLVVGLNGTGDQTTQTPFTTQSIVNMLQQLGVAVPNSNSMQLRDVAAVMVTANLPPFAAAGQRIDVNVSAMGSATSLRGGTLLMTPMKGVDGQIYAMAQGNLVIGGVSASASGSSVQVNQSAAGTINGGAIVERSVPDQMGGDSGTLYLHLHHASFVTAERVVDAINNQMGASVASAENGGTIRLVAPTLPNARVDFIAQVDQVNVTPAAAEPRVVINARTGSVVLNQAVTLSAAAVAHGSLSVTIATQNAVAQPGPLARRGRTARVSNSQISVSAQKGRLHVVQGASLMQVVKALNAMGATPQDLISIIEALKAAGSLHAQVVVM